MKAVLQEKRCGWAATEWYERALKRIASGQIADTCRSEAELPNRVLDFERLYQSVQRDGYRSQVELARLGSDLVTGEEVGVAIGRSGEMLFCDGAHRLCVALLTDVEAIPVQVAVRHPAWAALRDELFAYARSDGGVLYQPALHADLAAVPSAHGCEDRWALMSPHLSGDTRTVLDIGANLGYFDNRLEDLGHVCTAVESDPTLAHFMTAIRDAQGHHFQVLTESILADGPARRQRYGVVLALNILHHFLKTRQEFAMLERLLRDLECEEMFFEPPLEREPQMVGAYATMTPVEFTTFVATRTGLTRIDALGQARDGACSTIFSDHPDAAALIWSAFCQVAVADPL